MNDDNADKAEREMALLALAATDNRQPSACPSDEDLAAFIDNRLNRTRREEMMAHLDGCSTCYQNWLNVASVLTEKTDVKSVAKKRSQGGVWRRIADWFRGWRIAVPVVALAGLLVLVTAPLTRMNLGHQITEEYATISVHVTDQLARMAKVLPMPWESTAFGFAESSVSDSKKALNAGLWAGRTALIATSGRTLELPEYLLPPERAGTVWQDTQWADYYALGRWLIYLWALANVNSNEEDWQRQLFIHDEFVSILVGDADRSPRVNDVKAALEEVRPLLQSLRGKSDETARSQFARRLEMLINYVAEVL